VSGPFQLAVCAELFYTDLPLLERVKRLHSDGFDVEIWDFATKDLQSLAATGATFRSMGGYEYGIAGDLLDHSDEFLRSARVAIEASRVLGRPHLNIHGAAFGHGPLPVLPVPVVTGRMWLQALRSLEQLARLAEREDVIFTLENLNTTVDHPGFPFADARESLALVCAVDSPHLRLNLDLYHAQIGGGNLIALIEEALPWVAEIQVADVPGRHEPGTGEVNYRNVARVLDQLGYSGIVTLEAHPLLASGEAISAFARTFSLPLTPMSESAGHRE